MFPAKQPSRVVITTNDGNEYDEYLEYPKGDPREPMTENDLDNKFNSLCEGLVSDDMKESVKKMIFDCEGYTIRKFMDGLTV